MLFKSGNWDSTISFAPGDAVTRGRTLQLAFAPGVAMSAEIGQTFHLFDWAGVTPTGAFAIGSPYFWDLSRLYTTGEVTFLAASGVPGDFNNDNSVDARDYLVWRKGLGATYSQTAYDVWRSHFGQTAGSGAALPSAESLSAAVPEPATLLMLFVGVLAMCKLRRFGSSRNSSTRDTSRKTAVIWSGSRPAGWNS